MGGKKSLINQTRNQINWLKFIDSILRYQKAKLYSIFKM